MKKSRVSASLCTGFAVLIGLQLVQPLYAQEAPTNHEKLVKHYLIPAEDEPKISQERLLDLLRDKVKYVFVIYQENRSFDSYFGVFPGAEGIYSHSPNETPGFFQELLDTTGSVGTIHPFKIGPKQYASDTDDIDHSHPRTVAKMDVVNGTAKMDEFAVTEELKYSPTGNPSLEAKQFGELAMAYEDCDTVPILWKYADSFVLFDHIFEEMTGPSTPGNLSIIAAQSGQTQWALHPDQAYPDNGGSAPGVPVMFDPDPLWGSPTDPIPSADRLVPVNPGDYPGYTTSLNMTYASLPLTMKGERLGEVVKSDRLPETDLVDVMDDVEYLTNSGKRPVPFGWYEEGFNKEVTDPDDGPVDANGTHASYITHHNGPQYFGYVSNNPKMAKELHGLGDFFTAVKTETLPSEGVFFVKGGYTNLFGLTPPNPLAIVQKNFKGDDDHPAYSDAQISEAMVAQAINAIAKSKYWSQSAIIITWDDSEGDYDHVPPPIRSYGPDGSPISNGPRVPLLLISPYSRTHYIDSDSGSHASVPKFVDTLFGLTPMALLPDEIMGRIQGAAKLGQSDLGPEDALTPGISDFVSAFSPSRLLGRGAPLPPEYVTVPEDLVLKLPAQTGYGCKSLGIVPVDTAEGVVNQIPADFNPLPKTVPGAYPYPGKP